MVPSMPHWRGSTYPSVVVHICELLGRQCAAQFTSPTHNKLKLAVRRWLRYQRWESIKWETYRPENHHTLRDLRRVTGERRIVLGSSWNAQYRERPGAPIFGCRASMNIDSDSLKSRICHRSESHVTLHSESSISIHLLSDLHLEIDRGGGPDYETFRITPKADILALLGDIGTLNEDRLFRFLRQQTSQFSRVLYVPGNHEFYHTSYVKTSSC